MTVRCSTIYKVELRTYRYYINYCKASTLKTNTMCLYYVIGCRLNSLIRQKHLPNKGYYCKVLPIESSTSTYT